MTIRHVLQAASITGVAIFMMAASANATTVTYNTNAPGTVFVGGGLVLNQSSGAAASLTYTPNVGSTSGTPSNINYGHFVLACGTCSTQAGGTGAHFNSFMFDLILTETGPSPATGLFLGTSTGGDVFSDVSQISINWAPLQLGTGSNNVSTGNFGETFFTIQDFTLIVAPNSGEPAGRTSIQGQVNASSTVPEPATFGLAGVTLLSLGILGRKKIARP